MFKFSSVDSILDGLKNGEMIVLVDDPNRENEGDLVMLAEHVTPEAINFMATHGRGLICMPVSSIRARALGLRPMVADNEDPHGTAFTISIDINNGSTGISAKDRALTIKEASLKEVKPERFIRPGHIFPLIAKDGLLKERQGHTEAAVTLANLCGSEPVAVICEILNEDGTMARLDSLEVFCEQHKLKLGTIADLTEYVSKKSPFTFTESVKMPTDYGVFELKAFYDNENKEPHLMLYTPTINSEVPPLVRVHSECFTGDVFSSQRCECGEQLGESLKAISDSGNGVLIYLRQEGRGIGLVNKLKAYKLQEEGHNTVTANEALGFEADLRDYSAAVAALNHLGIKRIELITGNPEKKRQMSEMGISIQDVRPVAVTVTENNYHYLKIKSEFFQHTISSKNNCTQF